MDRLIRTAWRAFWVGLGASGVLLGQSLLGPGPGPGPSLPDLAEPSAPMVAPAPNAARPRSVDPVLSQSPHARLRVSVRAGT